MRRLAALVLLAPAAAAAQGGPAVPPSTIAILPSTAVVPPPRATQIDPDLLRDLELKRLQAAVADLTQRLTAAEKRLGDLSVQVFFDEYKASYLENRFKTHYHRVNGQVGSGFSSVHTEDDYISYMLPIKDDAAEYQARATGGPLP